LVRAVYGPNHTDEEHSKQKIYKPRFLRQIRGGNTNYKYLAFPDGIPGGWNEFRKIHFVAHSLGA
jgi:hypothetical protein